MRGVWRAWIIGLGLGLAPVGFVLFAGPSSSMIAGVLLTGLLAALPGLAILQLTLEAERFLQGMRRSSGRVEIIQDRLDWLLRRHLWIETQVGTWRVQGTLNPFGQGILVRPPEARGTYKVEEDPREAGRVLMARVLTARPALHEAVAVPTEPEETDPARRAHKASG